MHLDIEPLILTFYTFDFAYIITKAINPDLLV